MKLIWSSQPDVNNNHITIREYPDRIEISVLRYNECREVIIIDFDDVAELSAVLSEAVDSWIETTVIENDPEAMCAIAESEEEITNGELIDLKDV